MAYPANVLPARDRTAHVLGDAHIRHALDFGGEGPVAKLGRVVSDTNTALVIPSACQRLQVGDLTDYWPAGGSRDPIHDQYQQTKDLFAAFDDGIDWHGLHGNHDDYYIPGVGNPDFGTEYYIDRATLAAAMAPYAPERLVIDEDHFSILGINGAGANMIYEAAEFDWLVSAIEDRDTTNVFIAHHRPLKNTVGFEADGVTPLVSTGPNGVTRSDTVGFFATDPDTDTGVTELHAMLAEYPQIVGWLAGHTHSPFTEPRVVCGMTYGANKIAAVNASAINYVGVPNPDDPIRTCYVTIETDPLRVEVRIRDHLNAAMVGGKVVLL